MLLPVKGEAAMHHVYAMAKHGKRVDIGRAQFLMDRALAEEAVRWVDENWLEGLCFGMKPDSQLLLQQDPSSQRTQDQLFWERYCELHKGRYGTPFRPDVDPDWS